MNGQAVTELALALPVLLALLLGIIGVGYLMLAQLRDQNGITTLVGLAETNPDWRSHVSDVDRRSGCNGDQPTETDLGDGRFQLDWTCHWKTGWLFDGTAISVSAEGVR